MYHPAVTQSIVVVTQNGYHNISFPRAIYRLGRDLCSPLCLASRLRYDEIGLIMHSLDVSNCSICLAVPYA